MHNCFEVYVNDSTELSRRLCCKYFFSNVRSSSWTKNRRAIHQVRLDHAVISVHIPRYSMSSKVHYIALSSFRRVSAPLTSHAPHCAKKMWFHWAITSLSFGSLLVSHYKRFFSWRNVRLRKWCFHYVYSGKNILSVPVNAVIFGNDTNKFVVRNSMQMQWEGRNPIYISISKLVRDISWLYHYCS